MGHCVNYFVTGLYPYPSGHENESGKCSFMHSANRSSDVVEHPLWDSQRPVFNTIQGLPWIGEGHVPSRIKAEIKKQNRSCRTSFSDLKLCIK